MPPSILIFGEWSGQEDVSQLIKILGGERNKIQGEAAKEAVKEAVKRKERVGSQVGKSGWTFLV